MTRSEEKNRNRWVAAQPRRNPDSHTQTYYDNRRGISYLGMIVNLRPQTLKQVSDLISNGYPANRPRIQPSDNFFDVVDRLDRDSAHRVLDLINGIPVYGETKPGTPGATENNKDDHDHDEGNNNDNNQAPESPFLSPPTTPSATKFTRTVETSTNIRGSSRATNEQATSVTYTVRNGGDGPTAVIAGLPPHDHVRPARVAEAMQATSEILAGVHKLVSIVVGK
ncbi:hypothetical protein Hte_012018 [Hypoxylon texense]